MENKIGGFFGLLLVVLITISVFIFGKDDYNDTELIINNKPSYTVGFFDGMQVTLEYLDSIGYIKDSLSIDLEIMIDKQNECYNKRVLEINKN